MWKKKIKSKKMQLFLVGLVLFVTTALFTMCICFMMELSGFAKEGISEENCPDCYLYDTGSNQIEKSIEDPKVKENIKEVTTLSGKTIKAPVMHKGKDISLYYDALLDASKYSQFGYITRNDSKQKLPGKGEVWIATTMADPNNIQLGDTICLEYNKRIELKVVGFFSSTYTPKPVAVTPMLGNIEDINALPNSEDAALHAVNLKVNTKKECDRLCDRDLYLKMQISREGARHCITDITSSIGGFGSAAGIIIFIVALFIISFIIRTNLIKEYRTIGIYKSLGYHSGQIISFYVKGYLLVGIIAITLGAFSSLALVYPIGLICTKYVEGFAITGISIKICIGVIVGLLVLLLLNVLWALRRVKRITPVEAIAIGVTSTEKKINRSLIKSSKSPLSMAVNEMFKYKKSTLMMILVLSVSMYLAMLFVMGYSSSADMANKGNLWFGIPKKDVYISGDITNELRDYVDQNQYVKSSVYGDCMYSPKTLTIDGKGSDAIKEIGYMSFSVMDKMDANITGVNMTKGYAPKHSGEISMGSGILTFIDKNVGDYVKVEINGVANEYLITGAYKTMLNNGYGAMLLEEDIKKCDEGYKAPKAYVCLKNPDDYKAFKKDIESKFTGVGVDDSWIAIENSVSSIETMLTSISLLFVALFIIFALLNSIIVLLMDQKSYRRRYGILKSLGFTTRYIIKQTICKYSILSAISISIAFMIHKTVSSDFLGVMVVDAFRDSNELLMFLIVGFVMVILGAAWLLSLPIKRISPVELMEE